MYRRRGLSLLVACAALTIIVGAQGTADNPQLRILSPGEDAYVTGPTLLRARIDPPDRVTALTFFVDGRQACALTRLPFECEWDAGPAIAEHQVRAVATLKGGERLVHTVRTKSVGYTERVDVDVVQVTVTVSDEHGRFVRDLPQTAFKVSEDGHAQTITHFASEDVPLELIAAIDISGSMGPAMPRVKTAVKGFLGDVAPEHQVTLLGFNDNIFTLTRKTTDRAERIKAVDRLAPWGSTALYDVLLRGVEMLGRQVGRKALIVFSDGEDQGSHVTLDQVEQRLQASDVTLYMIGQGRGQEVDRLKKIMERLSTPTGGRVFAMASIKELSGAFDTLLEELSHQYLIGYPPPGEVRDGKFHEIRVRVDGHKNVRARTGYRFSARP